MRKPATFDLLDRCAAYAPLLTPDRCFSHVTAALLWGCPLPTALELGPLHVSAVGGGVRPRMRGIAGHEICGDHVRTVVRGAFPVTDPVTTWLQLAGTVGQRWLIAVGDHLVLDPIVAVPGDSRPHVEYDEFLQRVRGFDGRHCRRALEAALRVRRRVESPRETFLRLELLDAGLPEPELNYEIRGVTGKRIIGDLVYPQEKIVVEYDGELHRLDSKIYRKDIERHDALLNAGWTHIRQGKDSAAGSVVARTRAALRAGGRDV